jgi:hypothetical protein
MVAPLVIYAIIALLTPPTANAMHVIAPDSVFAPIDNLGEDMRLAVQDAGIDNINESEVLQRHIDDADAMERNASAPGLQNAINRIEAIQARIAVKINATGDGKHVEGLMNAEVVLERNQERLANISARLEARNESDNNGNHFGWVNQELRDKVRALNMTNNDVRDKLYEGIRDKLNNTDDQMINTLRNTCGQDCADKVRSRRNENHVECFKAPCNIENDSKHVFT